MKKETKSVWKKVAAPISWRPKHPGEQLLGLYVGRTTVNGMYGKYEAVLVRTSRTYMISGIRILQLFDSAYLDHGELVRVEFTGVKKLSDEREMRMFELYVQTEEPLDLRDYEDHETLQR